MAEQSEEYSEKLVPLTVRFTGPAIETIKSIAKEHGFSAAEIIRFTMDNKLKEYLGSVQFMDYDQGEDIRLGIIDLEKVIASVGHELNRIGVNYNQEVRLHNIAKKYGDPDNLSDRLNRSKEEKEVLMESKAFSREEVEELFRRYEETAKKVGELICLIQG